MAGMGVTEHRQTLRPTAGVPKPSSRGKDLDSIDTYAAFTADLTLLSEEQGSTDVVVGSGIVTRLPH